MKASDWISVEDRLPRTPDYVFVCRECGGERWTSLAAYVRFEEYAYWYDPETKEYGIVKIITSKAKAEECLQTVLANEV